MWLRACLEDKLFNLSRCQLLERQEEFFIGRMVRRCICLEYVDQGGKFGWSWMNNGKQNSEEKIGVYIWKFGVVWTVRVCSAFEQAESFSFNLGRAVRAGSLYLFILIVRMLVALFFFLVVVSPTLPCQAASPHRFGWSSYMVPYLSAKWTYFHVLLTSLSLC
jgi:hypothetical protein